MQHSFSPLFYSFPTLSPLNLLSTYRFILTGSPVVADQRAKVDDDELLRKLSRESEIRYTGHRDRPLDERVRCFANDCREGRLDIAYVSTGTNLSLTRGGREDDCFDFDREPGKGLTLKIFDG